ncbi:hypothetical protein [Candidatus Nitrosotalea okcheonensis]|uniref:Uncharacterized protein n=1 Tax=Candidatus Nitrosotalea okcheonensis TaxID=1903276 RepID=A0A2H1FDZ9_9ARCH|nr:hypothetical protein [Candidatus Nitrosotalea okcheonensis]SMH70983.1 conserved protein of unknown function [Candidatus Nitrosotalea okcheonensis]
MINESKWVIEHENKSQLVRASTIKPRIDYATEIVDGLLDILVQHRHDVNQNNLDMYNLLDNDRMSLTTLEKQVRYERELSYTIESLRQIRRSLDCIVGLGNVPTVLSPTISVVRTIRSKLLALMPAMDFQLGELSLLLGGIIIDAAHLGSATLDFAKANEVSGKLLDEAKLIADSKICKQFPNLDFW